MTKEALHVRTHRSVHRILSLVLGLTLLAASAGAVAQGGARTTVTMGVESFVLGTQIWVAEELGLFAKYGIQPSITVFSLGVDTVDAVLTGQNDVGIGLDFATLTRLRSGGLRVVSEIINPEPGFHQLAARGGIMGAADLVGKRMGIAQGAAQHYITLRYLQVNGVDPASVDLVPLGSVFEIVAALRANRIDAAWVWGDGVAQARESPGVSILMNDSAAQSRSIGYLVVSPRLLDANPEVVANILRALAEATDWIHANMEEASRIVARQTRSPQENVLAAMRRQNFVIGLQQSSMESLTRLADFMLENRIFAEPVDPLAFVVSEPLRQAAPERIRGEVP
jgi:ABC-type nitrate/sulfonate/bicarbonate transport system substrate-binding protein